MWDDGIDKEVDGKFYGKLQQLEIGSPTHYRLIKGKVGKTLQVS